MITKCLTKSLQGDFHPTPKSLEAGTKGKHILCPLTNGEP